VKEGSEIFTDILLEKQLMTEVENFSVYTDIKWFTLNNIDKEYSFALRNKQKWWLDNDGVDWILFYPRWIIRHELYLAFPEKTHSIQTGHVSAPNSTKLDIHKYFHAR